VATEGYEAGYLNSQMVILSDTAQDSISNTESKQGKFSPRFFGTFDWGRETSMPCWPETNTNSYSLGGEPVSGYGFGVGFDYKTASNIALIFDIAFHTWRYQVAEKGSRGTSMWVFEQTDYTSYYTGTFDRDAYFFMDATVMRFGVRYFFPVNEKLEPWVATAFGMAAWKGDFMTEDKSKTYGGDNGNGFGVSYMVGVDVHTSVTISFFLEGGYPVAKPIEVEDLIYSGWSWKSTAGEHAMLPYRFGISISM